MVRESVALPRFHPLVQALESWFLTMQPLFSLLLMPQHRCVYMYEALLCINPFFCCTQIHVVQKYLERPLLLPGERKFDSR